MSGSTCTYTMLSMVDWHQVDVALRRELMKRTLTNPEYDRFVFLRSLLEDIMNNGEMYFKSDQEEKNYFTEMFEFVIRKG